MYLQQHNNTSMRQKKQWKKLNKINLVPFDPMSDCNNNIQREDVSIQCRFL